MIRHMLRHMIAPFMLVSALTMSGAATAQNTPVSVALDWTLNTNHIGFVIAKEKGFYADAGLDVELLPYSDTSSVALLAAGKADFAYMTSLGFMGGNAANANLTALWATTQHENGRLVYNADNKAITRPADLTGKTYAGFGSTWENALIATMIQNDGGSPVWDTVTLGTGAYEALASGKVDFTLEVETWEGVNGKLLGRNQSAFKYADYGIPDQQNGYIGIRSDRLESDQKLITDFMKATQKGYEWAADHPAEAAEILIKSGDFPNPELVRGSMAMLADGHYLRNGDTPVGTIETKKFNTMAKFLFDSGVLKDTKGNKLQWPGDVSSWVNQDWMKK